jgi:hypothetical protein
MSRHKFSVLSRDDVTIDRVFILTGFIEHIQIVTTTNYIAIANSQTYTGAHYITY